MTRRKEKCILFVEAVLDAVEGLTKVGGNPSKKLLKGRNGDHGE